MKPRLIFALSLIVIFIIGVIAFIIDKFVTKLFPPSSNEPAIVVLVMLIVGVGAFLSSLNGVMDLVDRLFPGKGKIREELRVETNFPRSGPLTVFLCQSPSDRSTVVDLFDRLVKDHYKPMMDNLQLLGGQNRDKEITKMVGLSHVVIICLSSKSTNKDSLFLREIKFILDIAEELPNEKIYLIPLRLDNCEIPERLHRYQWVNFYEDNGYDQLVDALQFRAQDLKLQGDDTSGELVNHKSSEVSEKLNKGYRGSFLLNLMDLITARPRIFYPLMLAGIVIVWGSFALFPSNGKSKPNPIVVSPDQTPKAVLSAQLQTVNNTTPTQPMIKSTATPSATPQKTRTVVATQVPTILPTIAGSYANLQTMKSAVDGMEMVLIPEGDFIMGYADSVSFGVKAERPQHIVFLNRYWIDRTEVTNAQYALCVQAKKCRKPIDGSSNLHLFYYDYPEYASYPRVNVNWNEAAQYCNWAGRRLPSEAEWEKAARGFDARIYPWGNQDPSCSLANYGNNTGDTSGSDYCVGDTTEAGSYPDGASPYGVLDLAGNAWEWVNDWFSEDYYANPPRENPLGPTGGQYRVIRGGCSISSQWRAIGTASRSAFVPDHHSPIFGFRCVMPDK
jgi:formylglycine-generating enzyme required for sulfatase activity